MSNSTLVEEQKKKKCTRSTHTVKYIVMLHFTHIFFCLLSNRNEISQLFLFWFLSPFDGVVVVTRFASLIYAFFGRSEFPFSSSFHIRFIWNVAYASVFIYTWYIVSFYFQFPYFVCRWLTVCDARFTCIQTCTKKLFLFHFCLLVRFTFVMSPASFEHANQKLYNFFFFIKIQNETRTKKLQIVCVVVVYRQSSDNRESQETAQ